VRPIRALQFGGRRVSSKIKTGKGGPALTSTIKFACQKKRAINPRIKYQSEKEKEKVLGKGGGTTAATEGKKEVKGKKISKRNHVRTKVGKRMKKYAAGMVFVFYPWGWGFGGLRKGSGGGLGGVGVFGVSSVGGGV